MLGAGIFALTGTLVSQEAGPAGALSYLLAAFAAILVGGCYVELSTILPHAGSVYVYTYFAIGELPAFIVGWTLIGVPLAFVPAVAKAFSAALDSVFSNAITNWEVRSLVLLSLCNTVLTIRVLSQLFMYGNASRSSIVIC
jgi:amino acid transporter